MSITLLALYVGRFLLGGAFVVFGLRNINAIPRLTAAMEKKGLLPEPRLWMTTGVGIQIVGGTMVALGLFAWLGALALVAFLVLAAYLFHPFWEFRGDEATPHLNAWIVNLALSGGFLVVFAISLPIAI